MPIHPLPQFEADLKAYLKEEEDRRAYEELNAPSTIVVRFGYMRMIGEFPYSGKEKPGCGSKLVVRTSRGVEIGEMLTSTCSNSGCGKSVTRKEMLEYIENSGGRQYPFFDHGRVIRVATDEDLRKQAELDSKRHGYRMIAKRMVEAAGLEMTIIEAEPILGNERTVIYFGSEDRIDFRDLVQDLSKEIGTKIELRQIGARDEARITADFERCGQYCCCKNFLKVLKPVSMKSAKIQKATLDPLKISGRCGRLMCCLRYEDETYDELRKNLPHRKSRVGTPEGDGIVISSQILTQLALVRLDNNTDVAIPIEELTEPEFKTAPEPGMRPARSGSRAAQTKRSGKSEGDGRQSDEKTEGRSSKKRSRKRSRSRGRRDRAGDPASVEGADQAQGRVAVGSDTGDGQPKKKRRRRRRRGGTSEQAQGAPSNADGSGVGGGASPKSEVSAEGSVPKKKRRRRRRRRPSGEQGRSEGGSGGETGSGSGGD